MRLSEYLEPELVLTDLAAAGPEEAISAMVERLHGAGRIAAPEPIRKAVLDRESNHTTCLGNRVALPHATIQGLEQALMLVATSPQGVPFGPDGDDPERLFFLLLSPADQARTHIKLLARIVRLVRHESFVETLLAAESPQAVIREIEQEDARHV